MAKLYFNFIDVMELVGINKDNEQELTIYDLFDEQWHKNGEIVYDERDFPTYENVDWDKVNENRALTLVGDHGVYLMPGIKGKAPKIVYALGCDPDKDEYFYENKVELFGGDDGALRIPVRWYFITFKRIVEELPQKNMRLYNFVIELTEDSVSLCYPELIES